MRSRNNRLDLPVGTNYSLEIYIVNIVTVRRASD